MDRTFCWTCSWHHGSNEGQAQNLAGVSGAIVPGVLHGHGIFLIPLRSQTKEKTHETVLQPPAVLAGCRCVALDAPGEFAPSGRGTETLVGGEHRALQGV